MISIVVVGAFLGIAAFAIYVTWRANPKCLACHKTLSMEDIRAEEILCASCVEKAQRVD
jgi:hypothetical protein